MTFHELAALSDEEARRYFIRTRWPKGPECPRCGGWKCKELKGKAHRAGVLKCYQCRKQFSPTVGTIFHSSHISLKKWLLALHLMCASKKGISALQLQRALDLKSYKSAWFMCHRLRHAMQEEPMKALLSGNVEVDETYVGGKPRKGTGIKNKRGRGTSKAPVLVLVERDGRAISKPIQRITANELKATIRELVADEATLYTDELSSYTGIGRYFKGGHHVVKHSAGECARGANYEIHSNTAESFFSLLKRGIHGAYHHVSKKHLYRYCAEFDFRWNRSKTTDSERTEDAMRMTVGKRLTYKTPIGHES